MEERCLSIRNRCKEYGLEIDWLTKRLQQRGVKCTRKSATMLLHNANGNGLKTQHLVAVAEEILKQYECLWG